MQRTTVDCYTYAIEDFLERFPDKKYPDDIHRYDIDDWRTALVAKGRTKNAVYKYITAMRSFFNWLKSHGYVNYNPCVVPRRPYKPVSPEKRPLVSEAQLKEFAKTKLRPYDKLLLLLPLTTGLKPREMCRIWGLHFDQEKGLLRVGKKTEDKWIPLRDDVLEAVKSLGTRHFYGGKPLFSSPQSIETRVRKLCSYAGVKGVTASRLANTYLLFMTRAALPPEADTETIRQALTGIPRID